METFKKTVINIDLPYDTYKPIYKQFYSIDKDINYFYINIFNKDIPIDLTNGYTASISIKRNDGMVYKENLKFNSDIKNRIEYKLPSDIFYKEGITEAEIVFEKGGLVVGKTAIVFLIKFTIGDIDVQEPIELNQESIEKVVSQVLGNINFEELKKSIEDLSFRVYNLESKEITETVTTTTTIQNNV